MLSVESSPGENWLSSSKPPRYAVGMSGASVHHKICRGHSETARGSSLLIVKVEEAEESHDMEGGSRLEVLPGILR